MSNTSEIRFQPVESHPTGGSRIIMVFVDRPITLNDILPFGILALIYVIIVQAVFSFAKKYYPKLHKITILCLIAVFPITALFFIGDLLLFAFWLVFDVYLLFLAKVAYGFHCDKKAPRFIYGSFKRIFTITTHITIFSQAAIVVFYFIKPMYLFWFLRSMIYGIYFAVLSREVVMNLSTIMAKSTGFFAEEGIPGRRDDETQCLVCTETIEPNEKAMKLICGHRYHSDCILGYCIIGNNNHCQFCKHGIDNKIFEQNYWLKSELLMRPLMNTMRSSIAFFIVIVLVIFYKNKP